MTGTVVFTGLDANGNRTFGVKMNSELFPADADDVLLRDLEIGDPATFMTERVRKSADSTSSESQRLRKSNWVRYLEINPTG